MGLLVDGEWRDRWYDTAKSGGRFVREEATFRRWVRAICWLSVRRAPMVR